MFANKGQLQRNLADEEVPSHRYGYVNVLPQRRQQIQP